MAIRKSFSEGNIKLFAKQSTFDAEKGQLGKIFVNSDVLQTSFIVRPLLVCLGIDTLHMFCLLPASCYATVASLLGIAIFKKILATQRP